MLRAYRAVTMPSPADAKVVVQPSFSHQLLTCSASAESGSTARVLRETVDTDTPAGCEECIHLACPGTNHPESTCQEPPTADQYGQIKQGSQVVIVPNTCCEGHFLPCIHALLWMTALYSSADRCCAHTRPEEQKLTLASTRRTAPSAYIQSTSWAMLMV